jgi:ABC-type amino acid transport substrate-binding protein
MAASVVSIAVFTAGVTSHLTTKQLEGDVHGAADLQSVRAGAAAGTSSMSYLSSQHIKFSVYPDFSSGLNAVKAGKLDAFVHDRPILYWLAEINTKIRLRCWRSRFTRRITPSRYRTTAPFVCLSIAHYWRSLIRKNGGTRLGNI